MQNAQIELLVLALQEGDQRAFGILYQHFTPQLKKYAALRVSQHAEDLVQNTWMRIQRDLRKLEDVRVFKSWLYRALRWEILDWCKRGIPLGTVKSRLHRAREQLKAHYQLQREESNHEH